MATTRRDRRGGVEWIGGIAALPAYVTDEGEPYRPQTAFWMDERGAIVGTAIGKPHDMLELAAAGLRDAMQQPMIGPPRTPDRVRVASPELAHALRLAHPSIEAVCAPTPELDEVFAMLNEKMSADAEGEQSMS